MVNPVFKFNGYSDQAIFDHLLANFGFFAEINNENSANYEHPGRKAKLRYHLSGNLVGEMYELHPQVAKNFDIKMPIHIAKVDFEEIYKVYGIKPEYQELPKFPAIQLDVSILIPKRNLAETYTAAIQKTDKTLVKKIELVDEYEGKNIEKDKRSLTYSITYRSDKETLTDEQVNTIHQKVISNLKSEGAVIRD